MKDIKVNFNERIYSAILNLRLKKKYEKIFDELGCWFNSDIISDTGSLMLIDHFGDSPCIWLTLYGPHNGESNFILNLFNMPFVNEGKSFGKINKKLSGYNMDVLSDILDKVVEIYRSGKAEYIEAEWCKPATYYNIKL